MPTPYNRCGALGGVGVTRKFVCFSCRQCFHTQRPADYHRGQQRYQRQEGHKCPSCSAPMWYAGYYFRAPRKNAIRKWKELEILIKEKGRIFTR